MTAALAVSPAAVERFFGLWESSLQAPALVQDCQIECGFTYTVAGQAYRGQAESLDFRYFPTRGRLNAEVVRLTVTTAHAHIVAHVDPRYPGHAWAVIRDDLFVPFTWGLFELELIVIAVALVVFLAFTAGQWRRAGQHAG